MSKCKATFETASGYVIECNKQEGHSGSCEGIILGSKALFNKDDISEEHMYYKGLSEEANNE